MKRVSIVCAIAALVATVMPLSTATAQTWEIHQYFGTPGTNLGLPGANPTATVNGVTGGTVTLPVFIRMQGGDTTATPELLTSFLYGVSGVIASGTGTAANFSANAGGTTNRAQGDYTDPLIDLSGAGTNVAGTNAPQVNFSLVNNMGFQGSPPGTTNVIGSRGSTLAPFDAVNGAWLVGTVAITVAPGTPNGTNLDLYFRTGQVTSLQSVPYSVTDQTSGATTVGYGANGTGGPDFIRFGTASTALTGRAQQFFSSLADARITVIPEPGTLGLLALGLLGLRRRVAK